MDNPQLSRLVVDGVRLAYEEVKLPEVNRIAKEHSHLVELEIKRSHYFRANNAIKLMRQLNSLKKFRFDIKDFEYATFIDQLDSDWKYSSKRHGFDNFTIELHRQ